MERINGVKARIEALRDSGVLNRIFDSAGVGEDVEEVNEIEG